MTSKKEPASPQALLVSAQFNHPGILSCATANALPLMRAVSPNHAELSR